MKKILLLCVGGLSTSQIATKLTELGKEDGYEFSANSVLTADWQENMNDYDMFMISPQTAFRFDFVKKEVKEYGEEQVVYQMKAENYILTKADIIYDEVKKLLK